MQNKKPPLWARIMGVVIAYAIDNATMLLALVFFAFGEGALGVAFVIFAFYERLTQIRDKIALPEFNLTINKGGENATVTLEGGKA